MKDEEMIVLCGANSYEQKYYFNETFLSLPNTLADEKAQQAVINKRFDEEQVRLKPFWESNAAKKAGKR